MLNKLKSQKGITGIDLSISLIIIILFISIIVGISMNVSSSLTSSRFIELSTNCMTEIMEKVDEIYYDSVEEISELEEITTTATYAENTLRNEIKNILLQENEDNELIYKPLKVSVKVEKYKPTEDTKDLVKKVTVKITYTQNNKEENMEIARLKTRYNVNSEETLTSTTN